MAAATSLLLIVLVVGFFAVNRSLRNWVRAESKHEAHLRDPDTNVLAYAIPNGIDPATIEATLARGGFDSGVDRVGTSYCLRIECAESQREQVRSVLETIPVHAYDGSPVGDQRVVFEDER